MCSRACSYKIWGAFSWKNVEPTNTITIDCLNKKQSWIEFTSAQVKVGVIMQSSLIVWGNEPVCDQRNLKIDLFCINI